MRKFHVCPTYRVTPNGPVCYDVLTVFATNAHEAEAVGMQKWRRPSGCEFIYVVAVPKHSIVAHFIGLFASPRIAAG